MLHDKKVKGISKDLKAKTYVYNMIINLNGGKQPKPEELNHEAN